MLLAAVCLLHTLGVREVYVKFVRLPLQRTVLDGGKLLHTSTLRANASLFGEIQSVEGISDNAPEVKVYLIMCLCLCTYPYDLAHAADTKFCFLLNIR